MGLLLRLSSWGKCRLKLNTLGGGVVLLGLGLSRLGSKQLERREQVDSAARERKSRDKWDLRYVIGAILFSK